MKTFALLAACLLVALFTIGETRLTRNQRNMRCRRCPRPSVDQSVCAWDARLGRNRTFHSECLMKRKTCRTGWAVTLVSLGPCPGNLRQPFEQQQGGDTESNESTNLSIESNEVEMDDGITTIAPASPTTMPPRPPTTPQTTSVSVTNGPAPPLSSGTTPPAVTAAPESEDKSLPSGTDGATVMTSSPPVTAATTARPCNSLDNCVPSSSVCGTDGTTYPSQCVLEVTACVNNLDTLTVAYAGVCVP